MFILLMLFLFKYIDVLVGKGFGWEVILELMLYASASNVPLALPLAILLSAIMTFGTLGEHYELVAIKSSGISLVKAFVPLFIVMLFFCTTAFFFSNNVMPKANLKMGTILFDFNQSKPTFLLKEGVFYDGIDGFSIKVGKKSDDGNTLYDLLIYDHSEGYGNNNLLIAKEGKMYLSDDEMFLIMNLKDGTRYEETGPESGLAERQRHIRVSFKAYEIKFDLSGFKNIRSDENLFKNHFQMMNLNQLEQSRDSLVYYLEQRMFRFKQFVDPSYLVNSLQYNRQDFVKQSGTIQLGDCGVVSLINPENRFATYDNALVNARNVKNYTLSGAEEYTFHTKLINRHLVEYHRKFTLSVACLVLFFIGAPLGTIIRKGGLGLPVVVAIIFFVLFHIISITGENFAKEGTMVAYRGMWMATVILIPLGIFLTYKAVVDSALFDIEQYTKFFKRFIPKINK